MSSEDLQKLYEEYLQFYDITDVTPSDELRIKMVLELAVEIAKKRACDIRDWSFDALPPSIKLGIYKYIELAMQRDNAYGVTSESIGGMTQSFDTGITSGDPETYFYDAFVLFDSNCKRRSDNTLHYVPVRKKQCGLGKGWRNY